MESLVASQLTSAAMVVWAIQALKKSKHLPWIQQHTGKLNRILSIVASAATAAAIHMTFDSAQGTLVVTGLTVSNGLHFIWSAMEQFAGQELIYEAVYHPNNKNNYMNGERI